MTKPTKKKSVKKYELSRANIQKRLAEISDTFDIIDTLNTSPNDVAEALEDLRRSVDMLSCDVLEEQW